MVLLGVAFIALVACGEESDATGTPPVDEGASSSSSSSSSSGSGGPAPGSSSGEPNETVSCPTPSAQSSCTIEAFFAYDVSLTTDASCKTSLYVTGKATPDASDFKLRRYSLTSIEPCAFERDAAFGELAASDVIAANDAGDVVSVGTKAVELLRAGQRIKCEGTLPAAPTHVAVLARDGRVGYLGHYGNVDGKIADISLSKITLTDGACAVAPFPLTGDPLTGINGIALDTKGRLHVADTTYNPKGAERVGIYDADGKLVSSYRGIDPEAYFSPTSITPCKGGICVDGFGAVFSFDENGITRGHAKLQPKEELATLIRYVGSVRGPLFVLGNDDVEPRHLIVDAMVRP